MISCSEISTELSVLALDSHRLKVENFNLKFEIENLNSEQKENYIHEYLTIVTFCKKLCLKVNLYKYFYSFLLIFCVS